MLKSKWFIGILVASLFCSLIFPHLDATTQNILVFSGINIILAVSLNLVNGFTGQFSLGHAGFMAVGGYTSAFLTSVMMKNGWMVENSVAQQFIFGWNLLLGGALACVLGWVVGLPSLRLRGDYLAIVTLGFGEIIRVFILNIDALGGARGFSGIPRLATFWWVAGACWLTLFVIVRLIKSGHGRALLAVREDELAAEAMGVNTTVAKVKAFMVGAFFAGLAGGLYGHYLTVLGPASFDFNKSFEIMIMVVLGGMGSISGSVVAAVLLTFLRELLRDLNQGLTQFEHLGINLKGVDLRMIFYSLILIGLMLTRPHGLFGQSELEDWIQSLRRRWKWN